MNTVTTLHSRAHNAIETLQNAFQTCPHRQTDGLILSALVALRQMHDELKSLDSTASDNDPEDYCCGV
ncbi:MAG: hypothetical protein ED859_06315 [Desulfuromonadales bacterium]|nr:MAG: hypothetical protein ED859_06315 [Desulfuromonadales bacterium]